MPLAEIAHERAAADRQWCIRLSRAHEAARFLRHLIEQLLNRNCVELSKAIALAPQNFKGDRRAQESDCRGNTCVYRNYHFVDAELHRKTRCVQRGRPAKRDHGAPAAYVETPFSRMLTCCVGHILIYH